MKIKLNLNKDHAIDKKRNEIKISRIDFNTIKHLKNKITDFKMRLIQKKNVYSINPSTFINLKDHLILKICEYMGNDLEIFFGLNKEFKLFFKNILKTTMRKLCDNLIIYKEIFRVENVSMTIEKTKENNES